MEMITRPQKKQRMRMAILSAAFVGCFLGSFCIGHYGVPLDQLIKILINQIIPVECTWTWQMEVAVLQVRLPRVLAAALIGAGLSVSGCVYQGMFKNPMVSPDVLGTSAASGFGAALGIMGALGYAGISLSAFAFGLLAVGAVCIASARFRSNHTLGLVLAGIMVGSLFQAATSYLKLVADPMDQLPAITYWLMGSLADIRMYHILPLLLVSLCGFVPLFLMRWRLNVLTLGEEEARALGVPVRSLRWLVILCATLLTAGSVAVSGPIGWVGLVIPHFARMYSGCDFRRLLPTSMLMGATFLIVVDDIARVASTSEIPIGILTAFVGAPYFIYLLARRAKPC